MPRFAVAALSCLLTCALSAIDTVTVTAPGPVATEGTIAGKATVILSRTATAGNLAVTLRIVGTATNGSDYYTVATAQSIPAGLTSRVITITPINDSLVEGSETILIAAVPTAAYAVAVATAAVVLVDDDYAPVQASELTVRSATAGILLQSATPGVVAVTIANTAPGGRTYSMGVSGGTPLPTGSWQLTDVTAKATRLTVDYGGNVIVGVDPTGYGRLRVGGAIRTVATGYNAGKAWFASLNGGNSVAIAGDDLPFVYDIGYLDLTTNAGDRHAAIGLTGQASGATGDMRFQIQSGTGPWIETMRMKGDGKIGIGTIAPQAKLDLVGDLRVSGPAVIGADLTVGGSIALPEGAAITVGGVPFKGGGGSSDGTATAGPDDWRLLALDPSASRTLISVSNITGDTEISGALKASNGIFPGRVLVGTLVGNTAVSASDAKLHVAGKIVAREVVVTQQNWADYVLATDYALPSLTEVKAHIDAHGHLPGVPSEAAIKADGVNAGTMLATHMAKIEELTLYAIRQDEALVAERAKREAAERRLVALERRLAAIEATLP